MHSSMVGRVAGLALVFACVAGCGSDSHQERLTNVRQPLVVVGNEIAFSTPARQAGGTLVTTSTTVNDMACNSTQCLIVWTQTSPEGHVFTVGRRVKLDGTLVDSSVFLLWGSGSASLAVAALGEDEFLVVRQDGITAGTLDGRRVRSSDGAVLDQATIAVPAGALSNLQAVATVNNYFVTFSVSPSGTYVVHAKGGEVFDGAPVLLNASWSPAGICSGPGQVGIVTNSASNNGVLGLQRVSDDGIVLDTAPIVLNQFAGALLSSCASDGNEYLVSFVGGGSPNQLLAARVRASDGTLLDPPNVTDSKPGAQVLNPTFGNYYFAVATYTHFDGTNFLVSWNRSAIDAGVGTTAIPGVLVDPATGNRLSSGAEDYDLATGVALAGPFSYAKSGGGLLAYTQATGYSFVPLVFNRGVPQSKTAVGVSYQSSVQQMSLVAASNGSNILVVWRDTGFKAVRVSCTGQLLDSSPISLGSASASPISVATNGQDYMVATDSFIVRVRADGTLGERNAFATSTPQRALVNDGTNWIATQLSTSQLAAASYQGTNVRTTSTVYTLSTDKSWTVYLEATSNFKTTGVRTVMVAWATSSSGEDLRIIIPSTGEVVTPPQYLTRTLGSDNISVTTDGERYWTAWLRDTATIYGSWIDPMTGLATGAGVRQLALLPGQFATPSEMHVGYDGVSWLALVTGQNGTTSLHHCPLGLLRFDGSETLIDSAPLEIAPDTITDGASYPATAIAGCGNGQSLVAYRRFIVEEFGTLVRGRMIMNDGQAGGVVLASGGSSSVGGASGVSSTGGATTSASLGGAAPLGGTRGTLASGGTGTPVSSSLPGVGGSSAAGAGGTKTSTGGGSQSVGGTANNTSVPSGGGTATAATGGTISSSVGGAGNGTSTGGNANLSSGGTNPGESGISGVAGSLQTGGTTGNGDTKESLAGTSSVNSAAQSNGGGCGCRMGANPKSQSLIGLMLGLSILIRRRTRVGRVQPNASDSNA